MAIIDFKSIFSKKGVPQEASAPAVPPAPASVADILNSFKERDVKYNMKHDDGRWVITTGISGEQSSYEILFVVTDEDPNDLTIRVFGLACCPESKFAEAYKLVNELNKQYRFLKFCLNPSNGNINIEVDIPSENRAHGAVAVEFFLRIMVIVDKVYPQIMRLIWA